MLPNCRQTAEQISENIDQPISGFRWFKLKLHLIMCQHCKRYHQQLKTSAKTINLMVPRVVPSEKLKQEILSHYRQFHSQHCDHHDGKKD